MSHTISARIKLNLSVDFENFHCVMKSKFSLNNRFKRTYFYLLIYLVLLCDSILFYDGTFLICLNVVSSVIVILNTYSTKLVENIKKVPLK